MSTLLSLFRRGAPRGTVTLFAILTLFPEAVEAYARSSILGLAQEKGKVRIQLVDFRDFTRDRHRTVDDRPFGGGPGMVLKPEPIAECVEWLEREHGTFEKIVLSPSGTPFRQPIAEQMTRLERILLLCGRYEGFDARVSTQLGFRELSVGDYVLAGGELAALSVTEAVTRLLPGVLGDERSAHEDSFGETGGFDHPHFTRPRVFRGEAVPDVLLSGDHAAIARWRAAEARRRTQAQRPDLMRAPDSAGRHQLDSPRSQPQARSQTQDRSHTQRRAHTQAPADALPGGTPETDDVARTRHSPAGAAPGSRSLPHEPTPDRPRSDEPETPSPRGDGERTHPDRARSGD